MDNYRSYVGPEDKYDFIGAHQFNNLISVGLRENHKLLDIGCGSLRGGKLAIIYLKPGNYYGIEPNQWLIDAGIMNETGRELIQIKKPTFHINDKFNFSVFNKHFDYILAQSIFSHCHKQQIIDCCNNANMVMNDGSIFISTFCETKIYPYGHNPNKEENYEGNTWQYPDCACYTFNYIKKLIESTGLKCDRVYEWKHPNFQTWIKITKP